MSEGSAKRKRSTADLTDEFEAVKNSKRERRGRKTKTKSKEQDNRATKEKFASIDTNAFHKIMMDQSIAPTAKQKAVSEALTYAGTKEESSTRLKEFTVFKEWLQYQRQRMADEFMRLADTKGFSELKSVIDDMNTALIDFDDKMTPLTDILDAIYKLRTSGDGLIMDAFKEIQADKEAEAERSQLIVEQQGTVDGLNNSILGIDGDIAALQTKKSWFGFGGVKKSALAEIARKEKAQDHLRGDLQAAVIDLTETKDGTNRESSLDPELLKSKEKLRELLDISSEGHIERQEALIATARHFVTMSQDRTGSVLQHLEGMEDRVENVADANNTLRNMYAIMHGASEDAASANQGLRQDLKAKTSSDEMSEIAKLELESKQGAVEEYISALDRTTVDTSRTLGDLSEQAARVKTMKDRNQEQVAKTRQLLSSGIGGVADRLVTVLNGVSMASLTESSELMGDSITQMGDRTREISKKEVLQKVLGKRVENDRLAKAIDDFHSFGEAMKIGTDLYKEELRDSLNLMDEAKEAADALKATVEDARAASSDVRAEEGRDAPAEETVEEKASGPAADPFKFG